jgi:aspartyl-tRNA(Asn)/glutamyl-tRNA(Gln) amidotransferase subunit C
MFRTDQSPPGACRADLPFSKGGETDITRPMSIDQKIVRRIARLARIRLSDDDVPRLEGELNSILKWIEMLNEVDTASVEPMTSVVKMSMKMRDDVVTDGYDPLAVTANAPDTDDALYVVPKIVE